MVASESNRGVDDRILVKKDDWGDFGTTQLGYTLPWPIPDSLRPLDLSH